MGSEIKAEVVVMATASLQKKIEKDLELESTKSVQELWDDQKKDGRRKSPNKG